MKELLNKLIEKGWKPRWWDIDFKFEYIDSSHIRLDNGAYYWGTYKIRELVSKESWLWQFCIANHLLKKYSDLWDDWEYIIGRWQDWKDCKTEDWEYIDDNRDSDIYHQDDSYQYRLIESALKDESELEQFLLDNIKIEWK